MKIAIAALLIGSAAAFAPIAQPAIRTSALSAVVTGADGKAASSKEEDLELTLQIIMGNLDGDDSSAKKEEPKKSSKKKKSSDE